jgi:hypothetical protein
MAKEIELETVFRGESAIVFKKYVDQPKQEFSPESRALILEAKQLAQNGLPFYI